METNRLIYEAPQMYVCVVDTNCLLLCESGNTDSMIIGNPQDGDSSFE